MRLDAIFAKCTLSLHGSLAQVVASRSAAGDRDWAHGAGTISFVRLPRRGWRPQEERGVLPHTMASSGADSGELRAPFGRRNRGQRRGQKREVAPCLGAWLVGLSADVVAGPVTFCAQNVLKIKVLAKCTVCLCAFHAKMLKVVSVCIVA